MLIRHDLNTPNGEGPWCTAIRGAPSLKAPGWALRIWWAWVAAGPSAAGAVIAQLRCKPRVECRAIWNALVVEPV